jgi:coenzyme F420-reducing hydrogenase delta subunit
MFKFKRFGGSYNHKPSKKLKFHTHKGEFVYEDGEIYFQESIKHKKKTIADLKNESLDSIWIHTRGTWKSREEAENMVKKIKDLHPNLEVEVV